MAKLDLTQTPNPSPIGWKIWLTLMLLFSLATPVAFIFAQAYWGLGSRFDRFGYAGMDPTISGWLAVALAVAILITSVIFLLSLWRKKARKHVILMFGLAAMLVLFQILHRSIPITAMLFSGCLVLWDEKQGQESN